jgi:hypothetical protein
MQTEDHSEAIERICRTAKHYPDLICPTEMWLLVAESLRPSDATEVLEALPPEIKDRLRDFYRGLPPAAYIQPDPPRPDEAERQAVYVQVVRWCEAEGPPPEYFPGIISVCIEDGVVKERRARS